MSEEVLNTILTKILSMEERMDDLFTKNEARVLENLLVTTLDEILGTVQKVDQEVTMMGHRVAVVSIRKQKRTQLRFQG